MKKKLSYLIDNTLPRLSGPNVRRHWVGELETNDPCICFKRAL